MANARFILTIDGGGTKTTAAFWTASGHLLTRARGNASNIYQDCEASIAVIDQLWQGIPSVVGLEPGSGRAEVALSLGLAGASLPAARSAVREKFAGFQQCFISTDGYAALIGAFGGGPGAIVTVGTGAMGCRIDESGKFDVLGGWGFPAGDRGSGAWLGLQLISDYLQAKDGIGLIGESVLWPLVDRTIGQHRNDILAWLKAATPGDFASFAPAIVNAAREGDEEALDLIHAAAEEITRLADKVTYDGQLPLQITGSLGRALKPWLDLNEGSARASPHRGAFIIGTGEAPPEFSD